MLNVAGKIASVLPHILAFLVGFATAIFAEPIRRRIFRPKLDVTFGDSLDYQTLTPELVGDITTQSYYFRIRVTNKKSFVARSCKAYLISIEKKGDNGRFVGTIYCDSIQLAWSCQLPNERFRGIDIAKGVNQYVDLIGTRKGSDMLHPQLLVTPFRYSDLFKEKGTYRYAIQVCAADTNPEVIRLIFEWNGVWDDFRIYQEDRA